MRSLGRPRAHESRPRRRPRRASHRIAAAAVAGEAPVIAFCAIKPGGLDELAPYRGPGRTLAFVGSSGVGKSTLVNALGGEERLAVAAVRADDDRERHTTTRRELVRLADGTCLIDTPGMRELGLFDADGDALAVAFDDVAALARACRFSDCAHDTEPGCAVREGVDPAQHRSLSGEAPLRPSARRSAGGIGNGTKRGLRTTVD